MKKAWIENNRIRDIAAGNPAGLFHPDIAALYDTDVPDTTVNGAELVGGEWVNPAPVVPPPPAPEPAVAPKVSPVEFMLLFTAAERVAIKAARATNPVIDDFLDIVDDTRLTHVDLGLTSTQEAVGYLALEGLIAEARIPVILSGVVQ